MTGMESDKSGSPPRAPQLPPGQLAFIPPRPADPWVHDQYGTKLRRDANTTSWLGRHWPIVIVALAVLAMCVGGLVFVVFLELRPLDDSTKFAPDGDRETVLSFVDNVRIDAIAAAYSQLCAPTRDRFDTAAFAAFVGRQKKIKGVELANHVNAPGTPLVGPSFAERTVFNVHLTFTDGTDEARYIPVVREADGKFRVCGDPY